MSDNGRTYRITIDLNVLDHLADGLYSSVAAVITETVANAWDAESSEVKIELDIAGDHIGISDDGIGMDQNAINDRYLRVGYRRRKDGAAIPSGRSVMAERVSASSHSSRSLT